MRDRATVPSLRKAESTSFVMDSSEAGINKTELLGRAQPSGATQRCERLGVTIHLVKGASIVIQNEPALRVRREVAPRQLKGGSDHVAIVESLNLSHLCFGSISWHWLRVSDLHPNLSAPA